MRPELWTRRRFLTTILLTSPNFCGLAGCGGSGGRSASSLGTSTATGRATLTVRWPERSRLIPFAAESIKVSVVRGGALLGEAVLVRPENGGPATATLERLPVGEATVKAAAYPNADGTGVVQAKAEVAITLVAGQVTPVSLTLASAIDRIEITTAASLLPVGASVQLLATAKNAAGEVVLTSTSTLDWSSDHPNIATTEPGGLVHGAAIGTATITVMETESGKAAQATVRVTPASTYLLVSGWVTDKVFRYDGATAAFLDVFTSGGDLSGPAGLAVGPDGNLYISGFHNDAILRFHGINGAFLNVFASGGGLDGPEKMIFHSDGRLYVVSRFTHKILRYGGTTGAFIDEFASDGLDEPFDMLFGTDGNLYVSSRNNNRVVRYNGTTGAFLDVFASGGGLDHPLGLAFGPDGNLYVASQHSNQILRYNGATGAFVNVFASGAEMDYPTGLLFGPDGNLYVTSDNANDVKRYDGVSGAFIDAFVPPESGGLIHSTFLLFRPVP